MGDVAQIFGFIAIMIATAAIAGGLLAFAARKQNQRNRRDEDE